MTADRDAKGTHRKLSNKTLLALLAILVLNIGGVAYTGKLLEAAILSVVALILLPVPVYRAFWGENNA